MGDFPVRAREFERDLAHLSHWEPSEIDRRTRTLRAEKMLPVGARGLNAPDIDAHHASLIILSLAASPHAPGSAQTARSYASLALVEGERFAGASNFGDAFAAILGDHEDRLLSQSVIICRTPPEARIE